MTDDPLSLRHLLHPSSTQPQQLAGLLNCDDAVTDWQLSLRTHCVAA
jgi:hypothetical protein